MALKGAAELLTTLGFIQENQEIYLLTDENICNFLEGEPAIDYRRRLAAARLGTAQEYQR